MKGFKEIIQKGLKCKKKFQSDCYKSFLSLKTYIILPHIILTLKQITLSVLYKPWSQEYIHVLWYLTKNPQNQAIYVDVLQDLVESYNETPHTSLNNIAP